MEEPMASISGYELQETPFSSIIAHCQLLARLARAQELFQMDLVPGDDGGDDYVYDHGGDHAYGHVHACVHGNVDADVDAHGYARGIAFAVAVPGG
ncbi:hypothetical protein FNAPI_7383 [Fusarium napiforme]|uniref:Uncharacterized protein n=1 Tax=Fusarium napiforme TaxID=42672 RepID=A0A8H5JBC0_9HYPO|nr:hypothetical protein FNAPI_7383 [Fusarium napiforme]